MFSVIIPVYNGEKFIRQAIECVRRQSFTAWELIIVNDGSRDGTARILDSYAGDARIRIIHQANGGVSAARNAAIAAANHDYLAFLDADDLWYDNHLQVLAELIEKYPDAGLYGTAAGVEFADGSRGDFTAFFNGKPDTLYLEDFFEAYARDTGAKCYNMNSNCFRREAALAGGCFREGCKIGEDLALSLLDRAVFGLIWERWKLGSYKLIGGCDDWYDPIEEDVFCIFAHDELARLVGASEKTIRRSLETLRTKSMISWRKAKFMGANRYYVARDVQQYMSSLRKSNKETDESP